jgi:hypothetical protein
MNAMKYTIVGLYAKQKATRKDLCRVGSQSLSINASALIEKTLSSAT